MLEVAPGRRVQTWVGGAPDGFPVVFFHGCPDTRRVAWTGADAARGAGIRLVAFNRPGYGASTPTAPSYDVVVDDTAELADSLGIDRFGVLGMSVGGTFALACAALLGDRVRSTALVATPAERARMDPAHPVDTARLRPDFLEWRGGIDPEDTDDAALAGRWLAALPEEERTLVDAPVEELAAAARDAILVADGYLADAGLVFARWPFRVEDVTCPVDLWYGEHDGNAPPSDGAWLAEHLPRAWLTVLPGLGHLGSLLRSWDLVLATCSDRLREGA